MALPERADDIKERLEYLKDRKDIDGDRFGLIRISEGGNIGPRIAATDPTVHTLVIYPRSFSRSLIAPAEEPVRLNLDRSLSIVIL